MNVRLALLFALFASLAFGETINPNLVTGALVSIEQSGQVRVSGGAMDALTLNISIPSSFANQKTTVLQTGSEGKYATYKSGEGNDYIIVGAKPSGSSFSYEIFSEVSTQNANAGVLPVSYAIPQDVKKYLGSDKRIQSNDSRIKALALHISANSTSAFEKVAKLASWVNDYVEYDESYIGLESDALTVLQEKRGVCVEYSTLFAALARSIGIPARYVGGYAYSSKFNQWLGHVWVEVYIGKWVQVDPTWLQAGYVDALHISKFHSDALVTDVKAAATVYPPQASIRLTTNDQGGAICSGCKTKSMQSSEPMADFEFFAAHDELGSNDNTILIFATNSTDYRIMPITVSICSGQEVFFINNPSKDVILKPNTTNYVVLELKTSEIKEGSVYVRTKYTCPILLSSPYLAEKASNVTAVSSIKNNTVLRLKVLKSQIKLGEEQVVYVQSMGTSDGKIKLVTSHELLVSEVIDGVATFGYLPSQLGENKIYAISESGVGSASFDVAEKPLALDFEVEYERELRVGNATTIIVKVDTGSQAQADISVRARLGSSTAGASASASKSANLSFQIIPREFGGVPLEVEVSSGNQTQTRTYMLNVIKTVVDERNNTVATVQKNIGQAKAQQKEEPKSQQRTGCATMLISILVPTFVFAYCRRERQ